MSPEERIADLTAGLHAALEEAIESPARWQVLLDASATLWRYSGGNVALLMMQMAQRGTDEPSLVAGYKEWARHGRTVLRGEHALWIIAPRTASMQELRMPDGQRKLLPLSQAAPPEAVATGKKSVVTGWRGQAVFMYRKLKARRCWFLGRASSPTWMWTNCGDHSLKLLSSMHSSWKSLARNMG
jgi:hypothetical protein